MDPPLARLQNELATLRVEKGNEHPDTLDTMMALGEYLLSLSMFAEAEPLFREALETRRRTLGDFHEDTIESLYKVARALYLQGMVAESEPLYREYVERLRRTQGDLTFVFQVALNTLGRVYRNQGKQSDANTLVASSRRIGRTIDGINL